MNVSAKVIISPLQSNKRISLSAMSLRLILSICDVIVSGFLCFYFRHFGQTYHLGSQTNDNFAISPMVYFVVKWVNK